MQEKSKIMDKTLDMPRIIYTISAVLSIICSFSLIFALKHIPYLEFWPLGEPYRCSIIFAQVMKGTAPFIPDKILRQSSSIMHLLIIYYEFSISSTALAMNADRLFVTRSIFLTRRSSKLILNFLVVGLIG